jgi:hypothetical protein
MQRIGNAFLHSELDEREIEHYWAIAQLSNEFYGKMVKAHNLLHCIIEEVFRGEGGIFFESETVKAINELDIAAGTFKMHSNSAARYMNRSDCAFAETTKIVTEE